LTGVEWGRGGGGGRVWVFGDFITNPHQKPQNHNQNTTNIQQTKKKTKNNKNKPIWVLKNLHKTKKQKNQQFFFGGGFWWVWGGGWSFFGGGGGVGGWVGGVSKMMVLPITRLSLFFWHSLPHGRSPHARTSSASPVPSPAWHTRMKFFLSSHSA